MKPSAATKPKVFCVGAQKTGTTSIQHAFLRLGYDFCGGKHHLIPQLADGDYGGLFELAREHEAFKDVPWFMAYKELDREFPNSKFILTVRDEHAWLQSVLNYWSPDMPDRFDHRTFYYGAPHAHGNESLYLETYRKHNHAVQEHFRDRPDQLLVLDLEGGDGWDELCGFLGRRVPRRFGGLLEAKFPHKQKGTYNQLEYYYRRMRSTIYIALQRMGMDLSR